MHTGCSFKSHDSFIFACVCVIMQMSKHVMQMSKHAMWVNCSAVVSVKGIHPVSHLTNQKLHESLLLLRLLATKQQRKKTEQTIYRLLDFNTITKYATISVLQ